MKAVIFTHFPYKIASENWQITAENERNIIESVSPYYKAFLLCNNIGLIYVYVDVGIRFVLEQLFKGEEKINIPLNELAYEHTIRNILKIAVDQTIREIILDKPDFLSKKIPKFQFIGLPHLASLLGSLSKIDQELVKNLANHNFTYDAPKFVEAVIRLARGKFALLSQEPILRFDSDVEVNEKSIDILLNKINNSLTQQYPYSFFSGGYGDPAGIKDPVNDHAVRCHWLSKKQTPPHKLIPQGEAFLRDLGELGATQIPNSENASTSTEMKKYLSKNNFKISNRNSEQVISGAGLYMSLSAIQILPPFMNFEGNITWVDDHLKRLLHEKLGHIAPKDLEHVENALFRQNRYPNGINEEDISWAEETYFYRLISGCIFHSFIDNGSDNQSDLVKFIESYIGNLHIKQDVEFTDLSTRLMQTAIKTTADILEIWEQADYGNLILSNWAKKSNQDLQNKAGKIYSYITSSVDDAIRYCKLIQYWNAYVYAIQKLGPRNAYWLFRSTDY